MTFNDIATQFYTAGLQIQRSHPTICPQAVLRAPSDRHPRYLDSIHCRRTTRRISLPRSAHKAHSERRVRLPDDRQCILVDESLFSRVSPRSEPQSPGFPPSVRKASSSTRCQHGRAQSSTRPATASMMTNFELAIVQSVAAFFVLLSFVITAAMLLLTSDRDPI